MKKLVLFFLFTIPVLSFSQPIIQWQKTYGGTASDEASIIRATSDGGFIVTGLSYSDDGDVTGHHGASDHWVVKLDAAGNAVWNNSFGGSGDDKGYDIVQTTDGGYIITGYESSTDGNITFNHGLTDYWVVKLDATGNLQWQKSYGGTSADNSYAIIQTLDGGYAVTGFSNTTDGSGDIPDNNGSWDYWFCKLDAGGNIQWQKSLGGSATDDAFGIVQNTDSSYVICGYSSSPDGMVTGNHGDNDYWIVKLDKTGALVWERSYGGSGSDRAFGISKTSDGGYIINGVSASADGDVTGNHGSTDYWVVKLDADGLLQWQHALGGSGDDFGRIAFELPDGGYMIGGRTNSPNDGDVKENHGDYDYWLLKLDLSGTDILWKRCFGGSGGEGAPPSTVPFMNVIASATGYFAMAGATFSTDGDAIGNVSTSMYDDNYWIVNFVDSSSYIPTAIVDASNAFTSAVNLFPNPVRDLLTVSFTSVQHEATISLYSMEGRLILTSQLRNAMSMQLEMGTYEMGMYLLKVTDENGRLVQKKIIRN